mgnify:CR=1 FL=1
MWKRRRERSQEEPCRLNTPTTPTVALRFQIWRWDEGREASRQALALARCWQAGGQAGRCRQMRAGHRQW